MRLVTWNVLSPEYASLVPEERRDPYAAVRAFVPWDLRRGAILERLAAIDADLVLLQEVSPEPWPEFVRALPRHVGERAQKRLPRQVDGVATFVRTNRVERRESRIHSYRDGTGYVALLDRCIVDGEEVLVVNVHLKWSADGATPASQLGELLALLDATPTGRRIIAGDFNVDVVRAPMWSELARRGFVTALEAPTNTWAAGGGALQADAVLASGLQFSSVGDLRRIGPGTMLPDATEPSDHLPIVVTLAD